MSVQYEESLLDFDLDFLHPTANKSVIPENPSEKPVQCRKSVSLTKKKIIATDSLIRKYYEKKEEVDQIERTLNISKEEYKQTCIELKNIVEKCAVKEHEAQTLRKSNVELREKCEHSQNLVGAMQSHANQLQNLVKQNETTIESLTIETQLQKANARDYEKKLANLQKENEELMRNLCLVRDVAFGKKKLNKHRKEILLKYNKHYKSDDNDSLFGDQGSDHESDTDSPPLACSKVDTLSKKTSDMDKFKGEFKYDNDHDSDCSNELASADTGRGSSLAFSDGEKCFNSPDYFVNHSPVNPDIAGSQRKNLVSTATSPIPFAETNHVATSPPVFQYEDVQITLSPLSTQDMDDSTDMAVSPTELRDQDVTDMTETTNNNSMESNITHAEILSYNTTEANQSVISFDPDSDICIDEETTSTSPVIIPGNSQPVTTHRNSRERLSERECLELNNSDNLDVNNAGDNEIEMILHRMRLHHTLLTPIPNSPSKSTNGTSSSNTVLKTNQGRDDNVCKDAEKMREENKILNEKLTELAQEILNIKDILRDKRLLDDNRQINSGNTNTQPNGIRLQPCPENAVHMLSNYESPAIESNKNITSKISIVNRSKKDIKKSKELVTEIAFDKTQTRARKSFEKDPCHGKDNDNIPAGHLSNSITATSLIIKAINTPKHVSDKLEFDDKRKKSKELVNKTPLSTWKSFEKDPSHGKDNDKIHAGHLIDPVTTTSVLNKGINTPKHIPDKLEFFRTPFSTWKSFEKDHDQLSNDRSLGHLNNSVSKRSLTSKVKKTPRKVLDKLEFEDVLPLSPVSRTEVPVHTDFSISSVPNNEEHSESDMYKANEIDEDSLPLSSMLEFNESESLHEEITQTERRSAEENLGDEQNHTEQPKNALKRRKLTKLEKMRNKLLPKGKIKNISSAPMKKLRMRPKQLQVLPKQISASDNAASLNNKEVYEKALKVMSELKSKENSKINSPCKNKPKNKVFVQETIGKKEGNEKELSDLSKTNNLSAVSKEDDNAAMEIINEKEKKLNNLNKSNTSFKHKAVNKGDNQVIDSYEDGEETVLGNVNDKCKKDLVIALVKCDDNLNGPLSPSPKKLIATRSRSKCVEEIIVSPGKKTVSERNNVIQNNKQSEKPTEMNSNLSEEIVQPVSRKRPKRASFDKPEVQCKRMLRSLTLRQSKSEENSSPNSNTVSYSDTDSSERNTLDISGKEKKFITSVKENVTTKEVISYDDIELFTCDKDIPLKQTSIEKQKQVSPKDSIFCAMVDKFAKQSAKNYWKKFPDSVITSTSNLLQEEIAFISELPPNETKKAMNKLVDTILNWGYKQFMAGLIAYLKDPERKVELFNKVNSPPAPPMTKSEQILLYIISQLQICWSSVNIVDCTLCNIEYMLFKLNRTPEFDTIESTSHFYAVLCRYFNMKSRLRIFMLDAMYCIQFKAVALIKQCLEVWMHVLPLAHMGIAKSPLVTCMVYLLHFYKCEDRFNRVQEIRNILNRKYFYKITDWNEPKIIEMFKNAINEVRAIPLEMKLLRIALIVIAKRHGARWCQNNIIKKLLLPMIESDVPERVKVFCISMLGPLLRPYPVDMKVHCEIVMNQLLDILKQNPSHAIVEAVFTSLIYNSKHCHARVLQALLAWKPQRVSPELEILLRDFVAEKPMKGWKTALSKIQVV